MTHEPLRLDVLLTESTIADRLRHSLDQRLLPELFFYWFPLSVHAWVRLCQDRRYRNYVRSDTLIQQTATQIVAHLAARHAEVISLGAGQGTKDLHVVEALVNSGCQVTYRPVDSGQMLLEMACEQARKSGATVHGLKADLTDPSYLAALQSVPQGPPRLVMMVGNTLGAFDPAVMLGRVRTLLREGDVFLIDGELGNDEATRAGYEHPANRAFALAPLHSIGLTEADGTLVFESSSDVMPGMHRLEKYFQLHDDRTVQVAGEQLHLKAGDCIHMNHSGKFERHTFLSLFTEAGFDVSDEYLSDDRRFLMIVAKPTS